MEPIKGFEASKAVGGRVAGKDHATLHGVAIDSRKVQKGDLFIAIRGPNQDGHSFIQEARAREAAGILVSKEEIEPQDDFVIYVDDTLEALQELARYHRNRYQPIMVGVTGSNGKTTTKDLIGAVLGEAYPTLKTEGNLNNLYGLPLSLFALEAKHKAAVLEMGMNTMGEIARLASIARPQIGVLTNIGPAHLENLKDLEGVAKAKGELVEALPEDGLLIYNGDDPYLRKIAQGYPGESISFGFEDHNRIRGQEIKGVGLAYVAFGAYLDKEFRIFKLPLLGQHNVYNALAALALGWHLDFSLEMMAKGLLNLKASGMRMEIFDHPGNFKVINDTYNSNPSSLWHALEVLEEVAGGKKIAVLGDMLELGTEADKAHRLAGKWVREHGVDWLITMGELGRVMAKGALSQGMPKYQVASFANSQEVLSALKEIIEEKTTILIKGSRGMAMESIVEGLRRWEM